MERMCRVHASFKATERHDFLTKIHNARAQNPHDNRKRPLERVALGFRSRSFDPSPNCGMILKNEKYDRCHRQKLYFSTHKFFRISTKHVEEGNLKSRND